MYDKCSDCEYGDVENLRLENQELEKQFEAVKEVAAMHLKNEIQFKAQQKEFIEYLKNEIKETSKKWGNVLTNKSLHDVAMTIRAYKEILSKYKEIVGDENE